MKKTSRNDPCPCGSRRKFKHCCMNRPGAPVPGEGATTAAALAAAHACHRSGDLPGAEALCRRILQSEPDHASALHLLGVISFQTGRKEAAVDLIRRAIRLDPSDPFCHSNLGIALQATGELDLALASYREALALKPDFAEVCSNMAKAFHDLGRHGEAVASCRRALALRPRLPEALNNLGNALLELGESEEATECYRELLRIHPGYTQAHYNLANVLRDRDQFDEAAAGYRAALALDPSFTEARLNLGITLKRQQRLDEAARCFHDALTLDPSCAAAHLNLGGVLQEQGRTAQAIEACQNALALDPGLTAAQITLGNLFHECGDMTRAIACYERALATDPENAIASHLLTALRGGEATQSPARYVEHLFDEIAGGFDRHLLQNLKYTVPGELVSLIRDGAPASAAGWDVLDLGCGTGLVGQEIAPLARRLVGVDLSSRMLAKARERGLYERLVRSELLVMMRQEEPGGYDVVVAADLLIYIGDIDALFGQARRLLRPGGLFGFSIERLDAPGDYRLLPSTRFAHSPRYIERMAGVHGFRILRSLPARLRLEKERPVDGALVLLGVAPDGR